MTRQRQFAQWSNSLRYDSCAFTCLTQVSTFFVDHSEGNIKRKENKNSHTQASRISADVPLPRKTQQRRKKNSVRLCFGKDIFFCIICLKTLPRSVHDTKALIKNNIHKENMSNNPIRQFYFNSK